jgi:hypothetical protein
MSEFTSLKDGDSCQGSGIWEKGYDASTPSVVPDMPMKPGSPSINSRYLSCLRPVILGSDSLLCAEVTLVADPPTSYFISDRIDECHADGGTSSLEPGSCPTDMVLETCESCSATGCTKKTYYIDPTIDPNLVAGQYPEFYFTSSKDTCEKIAKGVYTRYYFGNMK